VEIKRKNWVIDKKFTERGQECDSFSQETSVTKSPEERRELTINLFTFGRSVGEEDARQTRRAPGRRRTVTEKRRSRIRGGVFLDTT